MALAKIRAYRLPEGVLPFGPTRQPFLEYSAATLAEAADLTLTYPEKRGMLSHAIRNLGGLSAAPRAAEAVTIEAHLDGKDVAATLAEKLIKSGFEPDGFVKFVPAHFNAHYTLKFKLDAHDENRRAMLLSIAHRACEAALCDLEQAGVEAYIELEVYPSGNRRCWSGGSVCGDWQSSFPLPRNCLCAVTPACDEIEAERLGTDLGLVKRADIHIKMMDSCGGAEDRQRDAVIAALCEAGFYRVLTWAGHDVCTAQFRSGRDAHLIYNALMPFFDRCGAATEMTLEPAPAVWRTRIWRDKGFSLASLPPVITKVDSLVETAALRSAAPALY